MSRIEKSDAGKREQWKQFIHSLAPQDVDPRAMHLMDEMRYVAHNLYQIGELSVSQSGLSYAKMRLLLGLNFAEEIEGRSNGLNPSEISDRQGTSRNTISALIRDLEEDRLIERTLDPDDRRRFNIKLTSSAKALVRDHVSRHLRIVTGSFQVLEESEQEQMLRLLAKLGERVQQTKDELTQETTGA